MKLLPWLKLLLWREESCHFIPVPAAARAPCCHGREQRSWLCCPSWWWFPPSDLDAVGKVSPCLGLVQFLLCCIWPSRENIHCHLCLTSLPHGLSGYISLGTGERPGDIFGHGSHGVQGDLYFVLSYPSCPAHTMGVASDHENCRRVVMSFLIYFAFTFE